MNSRLLSFNIIPVVVIHILFLPLWFLQHPFFTYNVSLGEMIVNLLLVPLYLILINYRFALKERDYHFWPYILVMLAVAFGSNLLTYFNWAIASGRMVEQGTFALFEWIIIFNFLSVVILGLIAQGALSYRKRLEV